MARQQSQEQPKKADKFKMDGEVDELEHFRKQKCPKGHTSWEGPISFIVDHQAYAVGCKECDGKLYFVRPGGDEVMEAPEGWAKDMGIE